MKIIKFKLEEHQANSIFNSNFLERLKDNHIQVAFRLDQFSELKVQPFHYFALSSEIMMGKTLKEVEMAIAKLDFVAQPIAYPKAVGMIPYEQATEFLPITLKGDQKEQICILPTVLLAVSTDKTTAYLMRIRTEPETPLKTLSEYQDILLKTCSQMTGQSEGMKQDETVASKGYAIAGEISQNKTDEAYKKMIDTTKSNIRQGEIFQAVISKKFTFPFVKNPYDFYLEAYEKYGMPYNCYIALPNTHRAYAITSPEMLVAYDDDVVRTRPIAGTRPLKNDGKDALRRQELAEDEKENAEHLMLVDLGRNDLSKVSEPGSIKLNFYKEIKPYHKVYHMVSEVVGKRKFENIFDPIRATFPAGTVSGAPKIRAMQIIEALEKEARNHYAGATYIIDSNDAFISCINIRCAVFKENSVSVQVGSGIVYDSETISENKELLNKIRGHLETMERLGDCHVFTY